MRKICNLHSGFVEREEKKPMSKVNPLPISSDVCSAGALCYNHSMPLSLTVCGDGHFKFKFSDIMIENESFNVVVMDFGNECL